MHNLHNPLLRHCSQDLFDRNLNTILRTKNKYEIKKLRNETKHASQIATEKSGYYIEAWDNNCPSLGPSGIGAHLRRDRVGCSIPGSVWNISYILHVHRAYDYLGPFGVLWVHMAWLCWTKKSMHGHWADGTTPIRPLIHTRMGWQYIGATARPMWAWERTKAASGTSLLHTYSFCSIILFIFRKVYSVIQGHWVFINTTIATAHYHCLATRIVLLPRL